MRALTLVTVLMGLAVLPGGVVRSGEPVAAAWGPQVEHEWYAWELLNRLNNERYWSGSGGMSMSWEANEVAQYRAYEMAAYHHFSHYNPWGVGSLDHLRSRGVYFRYFGENIAKSTHPPEWVVDSIHQMLMASPAHRANMLAGHYRRAGIGVASHGGVYYVTMVFLD